MFKEFVSIYLLFNMISIIRAQDFCNPQYQNVLLDSVFNFGDTVYAFRAPDSIWIMKYDKSSQVWQQIGNEIKLKELFAGFPKQSFDSVIPISEYSKCDPSQPNCHNKNRNFDPTNVTIVFVGRDFLLYRRINQTLFTPISGSDNMIPWEANKLPDPYIVNLFTDIMNRINSAVYVPNQGPWPEFVALLTIDTVFEYLVTDFRHPNYTANAAINNSPTKGNGGIFHNNSILFFGNNNIWQFHSGRTRLIDLSQKYWQFFSCDLPKSPSISSPSTSTSTMTIMTSTEPVYETESDTELTSESIPLATETRTDDMSSAPNVVGVTESDPSFSTTGSLNTIETFTESKGLNGQTVSDISPVIVVQHTVIKDQNFRYWVYTLSLIFLALVIITAVLVTISAVFAYKILTKQMAIK